ncbi:amidohydrolase family protein [Actinomadura scrupuli]|uniref:amidohydrolase family protein n=1 Tax=Actinomadura scrupuli TaxID=559629 RepID=UPI003D9674ED
MGSVPGDGTGGGVRDALRAAVAELQLVDHHVHGAFHAPVTRARFEESINEGSPDPIPGWMTQFDSQLGFAIRRWCAPLLDLPEHAPADDYWARRAELGEREVAGRLLPAAGVSDWLVDTGYLGGDLLDPSGLAAVSGGRAHEIVRLEALAESLAAGGISGAGYADAFRDLLRAAGRTAAGVKTVVAYRTGFDIDWTPPAPAEVTASADRWLSGAGPGPRLTDPTLLRFGIHSAVDLGLPIQIHVGYGDRDLDLHRADPMLLLGLLRRPEVAAVPIMLLHCYPYHRQAGYLAQSFPNVHLDVGLVLNHMGARATAVVAESLELAPFAKVLYSSDACGPAELHYLGARLWRHAITGIAGGWVSAGDWSAADAERVITMIGRDNARRVYHL